MPIYVMPNVPPQDVPVMVAQATAVAQSSEKTDRVIAVCHLAQNPANPPSTAVNVIEATMAVEDYLTKWEHKKIKGIVTSRILQQPSHGLLRDEGGGAYSYVPELGYLGKDQGTLLVEMSGLKVKVIYFFQVLGTLPDDADEQQYCPKYKWKISQVVDMVSGTSLGNISVA